MHAITDNVIRVVMVESFVCFSPNEDQVRVLTEWLDQPVPSVFDPDLGSE